MAFDEIIGHDNIKNQMFISIDNNTFSHAHIISGEDGIGKSLIAREAASEFLSREGLHGFKVDIVEFKLLEDKKSIGIDEVKNIIREANRKPTVGKNKVIIIYNSDKITETAQNALLKTVEEPPDGIVIIMLCEKLDIILDTIKSRCQIHKLNRLKEEEMKIFLKRKFHNLSDDYIKSVCAFSDGIPGRAEKFISDKIFHEIRNKTLDILKSSGKDEFEKVFQYENFFIENKNEWQEIFTCLLSYIRDALVYKETGNKSMVINIDKFIDIKGIAEEFSFNKLIKIIDIVKDTSNKLKRNVNFTLVFDSMLLNMQEV